MEFRLLRKNLICERHSSKVHSIRKSCYHVKEIIQREFRKGFSYPYLFLYLFVTLFQTDNRAREHLWSLYCLYHRLSRIPWRNTVHVGRNRHLDRFVFVLLFPIFIYWYIYYFFMYWPLICVGCPPLAVHIKTKAKSPFYMKNQINASFLLSLSYLFV